MTGLWVCLSCKSSMVSRRRPDGCDYCGAAASRLDPVPIDRPVPPIKPPYP